MLKEIITIAAAFTFNSTYLGRIASKLVICMAIKINTNRNIQ